MLSSNGRKKLLVFLSLLIASTSIAAPTVGDYSRDAAAPIVSSSSDARAIATCEINQIGERANSYLANAAAEFLKPPTDITPQVQAKSLPPEPGALFLVLTGFLCVSLVKDRRVWLAALVGLLWLGQAGITALPHLASHLRSKKQIQQSAPAQTYVSELDGSFRLQSDIEGTQYIGLLRHLAGIPATAKSVQRRAFTMDDGRWMMDDARWTPNAKRCMNAVIRRMPYGRHLDDKVIQFAIVKLLPEIVLLTNCSVTRAGQAVPFSPAFIFSRLARGPPEPA